MGTKNFLFLVVGLSLTLSACQTRPTKPDSQTSGAPGAIDAQATQGAGVMTQAPKGAAMPVGVFLGPGALRSFAHVGVLRVFAKNKIPVVVVGGSEWGAVVAATFGFSRGYNEPEWQMMKLRKEQLPQTSGLKGMFKSDYEAEQASFFKSVFGNKKFEQGRLPFLCFSSTKQGPTPISSGVVWENLIKCSALAPLFELKVNRKRDFVSGAVEPADWAGHFRRLGAQYLIYVDVISRGSYLDPHGELVKNREISDLWNEVREVSIEQSKYANKVIEIGMDMDLMSYENRRAAIAHGEKAASGEAEQIRSDIGMNGLR
ncbi:MAG: hypothetical protein IT289_05325 [Oligoflexia bacterium]|nr:hypothetical protein [Oligoflexia bacterium]